MSQKIWEIKMTDHGNVWNVRGDSLIGAINRAIKLEQKFVDGIKTGRGENIAPGKPRSAGLLCSVHA